jgi:hypothetical protein
MDDFLAVGNYPQINQKDLNWINDYRKKNDVYYDLIDTHFTFVFPTFNFESADFITEIKKQAKGLHKIEFQIKCVLMNNDRTNDYWHVLMVPDKGFSEIVKLHDKLYADLLAPTHRLDLDFIPHIAIGNSTDPQECKKMVDDINAMDIDVCGVIDQLDIIQLKDNKISTMDMVKLI